MRRVLRWMGWLTAPIWVPVWLPFWLLRRSWRWMLALTLAGLIGGCATDSGRFERSPCACRFLPLDVAVVRQVRHG